MNIGKINPTPFVLLAVGSVLVYVLVKKFSNIAGDTVESVAGAFTDRDNIVNQTANSLFAPEGDSIGGAAADHCSRKAIEGMEENGGTFADNLPWYCPTP